MGIVLYTQVLPVVPVAQPRQRMAVIGGHAHNYASAKHPITDYKAQVRLMVSEEMRKRGVEPFTGGLILWVEFYLPRPKRLLTKKSPDGPIPHLSKPDLDNLIKGTKDSLKGVLWNDDSQVYGYDDCYKWYCEKGGQPRAEVTLIHK